MNIPLAKAMSGWQFLLNRVRNLQETVAQFALSAQLDLIIALVSTCGKRWSLNPGLLYLMKYKLDLIPNAGQLWFPLYSVLRQTDSADCQFIMTMETSKRTREKFKKLIQKYTDVLKQPVMLIFTEEAARRGIDTMANHVPTTSSDTFDKYKQVLDVACHETLFKNKKRFIWSPTWRNKVDLAMEDMRLEALLSLTNNVSLLMKLKDEKKRSVATNRAYSDLLKLLDDCGLAKHRSWFTEAKTHNCLLAESLRLLWSGGNKWLRIAKPMRSRFMKRYKAFLAKNLVMMNELDIKEEFLDTNAAAVDIQSLHRGWVLGHTSLIGQYSPFGSSFEFLFMEEWERWDSFLRLLAIEIPTKLPSDNHFNPENSVTFLNIDPRKLRPRLLAIEIPTKLPSDNHFNPENSVTFLNIDPRKLRPRLQLPVG
ncbi:AAA+ ATPase domain-containing protein [Artemisia annua]|uniref:AAA+ ATPase domain-containing protein n=1 Tax=Artemisia annua TaxID=35608 RepID=A0A2U1L090_ARTAN|nr:AAA+ ATPase domain-containing protein [Artemisia annua]